MFKVPVETHKELKNKDEVKIHSIVWMRVGDGDRRELQDEKQGGTPYAYPTQMP